MIFVGQGFIYLELLRERFWKKVVRLERGSCSSCRSFIRVSTLSLYFPTLGFHFILPPSQPPSAGSILFPLPGVPLYSPTLQLCFAPPPWGSTLFPHLGFPFISPPWSSALFLLPGIPLSFTSEVPLYSSSSVGFHVSPPWGSPLFPHPAALLCSPTLGFHFIPPPWVPLYFPTLEFCFIPPPWDSTFFHL